MTDDQGAGSLFPVVGMVGAGQLARMTYQASIPLGVRFRVLADTAADSAAQVCPDVRLGDYHNLDDLLAFANFLRKQSGNGPSTWPRGPRPGCRWPRAASRSATPRTSWPCARS